jgi:hypothetical protein
MSTAWKGSVVLLREPASALAPRLGYRLLITGLLVFAAVFAPWTWAAVVAWVFAGLAALLAVLAVVNVLLNRRVILRYTGAGSIEWPQSIQERVLRRPLEWVAAREIEVTYPPIAAMPGNADPRVRLSDGTRVIDRVPLYGVRPEAFVDAANALLVGRGVRLVYVARAEAEAEPVAELPPEELES